MEMPGAIIGAILKDCKRKPKDRTRMDAAGNQWRIFSLASRPFGLAQLCCLNLGEDR